MTLNKAQLSNIIRTAFWAGFHHARGDTFGTAGKDVKALTDEFYVKEEKAQNAQNLLNRSRRKAC